MLGRYEVWYRDNRNGRMWVIYTMAHSFEEARKNTGGRPVDCRKALTKRLGTMEEFSYGGDKKI